MASVASALRRIKDDLSAFLPESRILRACEQAGYQWRQRKLGAVQTIHLFVLQVLNFNTAMTGLRHLSKTALNASSYCKARMRLPLEVLQTLLIDSSQAMRKTQPGAGALWCGLKVYLVDCSSTIAPDTPDLQKSFGQPKAQKPGCGFAVPKLLGLFDAVSGMIVQMLAVPLYTHEQSKVWLVHPLLGVGDLLVGDRAFCSFVHLAMLLLQGIHGLFRMHQKQLVNFRPHRKHRRSYGKGKRVEGRRMPRSRFVKRLGHWDQLVDWFKPAPSNKPTWMSAMPFSFLPDSLRVRELRFVLARRGQRTRCVTIVTTLLDPVLYPKEKIAELYGVRWQVETHFAELKTTLKMRKVKSQTAQGVLKELIVYALVYNLVHLVMVQAARRQGVPPQRISFLDTLRWLTSAAPGDPLPDLLINPHRPGRHEPRVVKDLQDSYTKMTRPRNVLRKPLLLKPLAT